MANAMQLRVLTYNVFGAGNFSRLRLPGIVDSVRGARPDVLCLQEATPEIMGAVVDCLKELGAGSVHVWSKRDVDEIEVPEGEPFLAVLAVRPFLARHLVYKGSWHDDGILRVDFELASDLVLALYNVHCAGGSFGKPKDVQERKQRQRILELKCLQEDLERAREQADAIVVCGDFNFDADEALKLGGAGAEGSPEAQALRDLRLSDCWQDLKYQAQGTREELLEQVRLGATESHSRNGFRAFLKPAQNREARFDRILVAGGGSATAAASAIWQVGSEPLGAELAGQAGNLGADFALFPSDHFGVCCDVRLELEGRAEQQL